MKFGEGSEPFYFEGTASKVGAAFFVTALAPDLSTVRFARMGANFIPRNAPVLADVDDVSTSVGFWRPQADFRIPERIPDLPNNVSSFAAFPDLELEAIFEDQVKTFVRYQTRVAVHAIRRHADADLVMVYIEQPDGSEHQFLLTDPRQATDPRNPATIGANQDPAKVARYASHIEFAYQQADRAVRRIMDAAGPGSDVFVVSDHGFAPFHTAVSMGNILANAGIDLTKVGIRTSGPAANIYVNLRNRESGGTVPPAEYLGLVQQIAAAVSNATDPNPLFNTSLTNQRVFNNVRVRPTNCNVGVGLCTNGTIGQDFGDVFAQMAEGYNFDGIQSPGVARQGDPAFNARTTVLSAPNFYGAHGHVASLTSMSATFLAAGPHIRNNRTVLRVQNIYVAPTIMLLLGVRPIGLDGEVLHDVLDR